MRIKTGIEGFDALVEGGLVQGRQYLISGSPGSGKTTFGIQFLANDMLRYAMQTDDLEKKKKLFCIDLGPSINYGEYDDRSNLIKPSLNELPKFVRKSTASEIPALLEGFKSHRRR